MQGAAHYEVDFDFHFDIAATNQELSFARVDCGNGVCLEALESQAFCRLAERRCDLLQCLFARQGMVGEDQIEIDGQAGHVAYEKIDGRAALEGKYVALEHERGNLRHYSRGIEIDLIHGLSTIRPFVERDTQGRLLPVGSFLGSSLAAHGKESSRLSCKQRRTVLTLVQDVKRSRNTSARKLYVLSMSSRASCKGWRTPTSLSSSSKPRSGDDTRGAPARFSKGVTCSIALGCSLNKRFR